MLCYAMLGAPHAGCRQGVGRQEPLAHACAGRRDGGSCSRTVPTARAPCPQRLLASRRVFHRRVPLQAEAAPPAAEEAGEAAPKGAVEVLNEELAPMRAGDDAVALLGTVEEEIGHLRAQMSQARAGHRIAWWLGWRLGWRLEWRLCPVAWVRREGGACGGRGSPATLHAMRCAGEGGGGRAAAHADGPRAARRAPLPRSFRTRAAHRSLAPRALL